MSDLRFFCFGGNEKPLPSFDYMNPKPPGFNRFKALRQAYCRTLREAPGCVLKLLCLIFFVLSGNFQQKVVRFFFLPIYIEVSHWTSTFSGLLNMEVGVDGKLAWWRTAVT